MSPTVARSCGRATDLSFSSPAGMILHALREAADAARLGAYEAEREHVGGLKETPAFKRSARLR